MPAQAAAFVRPLPPRELHQLARKIHRAVAALHRVERSRGFRRLLLLSCPLIAGAWLYWGRTDWPLALLGLVLMALAETGLLITTHEALHGTLLACPRLEALLSCLICWPMAFPWSTYSVLHLWHHRWNSKDARDPERIRSCSRPWLRWAVGAGGIGLILATVHQAWILRNDDPRLSRRLGVDATGIIGLHGTIFAVAISHGVLNRYLLSWLVVERLVGGIMQTRALIEHGGLWQPRQNHLLSQLYGSRNIAACGWINSLMGGLPHHSAHHAFPGIPSALLPEATARIEEILVENDLPRLPRSSGYFSALREL